MQEETPTRLITDILQRQPADTIAMLRDVVEKCPEEIWGLDGGNVPIWQQIYHIIFWLNAWARDWSKPLEKPAIHSNQALELENGASPMISREQMRGYLDKVESECMSFLDNLTD